jgi:OTU domain-containing protein 7
MLPDLTKYPDEFRDFLQQDLIEISALVSLSEAGHLNWWSTNSWDGACRMLQPMVTSGDGNCLLHAASLAMWGLHDRYLILRKALHSTLEDIKPNSPLWRRWKWEQMKQNSKFGLVLNEDEWSKEWSSLLKLSSYQPRNSNQNNKPATTLSSSSSNANLQVKESSSHTNELSTNASSTSQNPKISSSNSTANSR